jgi:hypothetical protein
MIVSANPLATVHRNLITTLGARLRLPAVYPFRFFVSDGGLISYGPDIIKEYERAAIYVDRILKGRARNSLIGARPRRRRDRMRAWSSSRPADRSAGRGLLELPELRREAFTKVASGRECNRETHRANGNPAAGGPWRGSVAPLLDSHGGDLKEGPLNQRT